MLPLLRREVVEKRQWATDEEMIDYYAIGQSTPGIICTNVATFIGFKLLGIVGAVIATVAVVLPAIIIITCIAMLASTDVVTNLPLLKKALAGINTAVAVLLFSALFDLGKKTIVDVWTALIAVGAFIAMSFLGVSAIWIVFASAALGLIIKLIKEKPNRLEANNRKDKDAEH